MDEQRELTPAEKHYLRQKEACKKYNEKNRDAVNERNRNYYKRVTEDPEKHQLYLEKKRQAYQRRKLKQEEK